MTLTYAHLMAAADTDAPVVAYQDDLTPRGTFAVTTKVLGLPTTYLFVGEIGLPQFTVCVGRQEAQGQRLAAYAGGNLKGGTYLGTLLTEQAYAAFLQDK